MINTKLSVMDYRSEILYDNSWAKKLCEWMIDFRCFVKSLEERVNNA